MSNFKSEFKDSSNESIGFSFVKVYNLWHKAIKDELKTIHLTHPQFIVLASLGYLSQTATEVTQVDISKKADIDVMTVSTIIRNLEKAQLLFRQESLHDTRAKAVKMTEKGQTTLTQALPIVENIDKRFFSVLAANRETFNDLLLDLVEGNTHKN
ncbi:DNA-binding MarR family transcriptional regulator [Enterococcus sp. PF1-24]|uniref:MarR family winged helix-turn-helix transcriptional regulator n=1 Tax=unclassified Enterococcus TaxID=2608891 RepID=UPI0024768C47|nr:MULTISPECIES: MarR family transcriptional regulator [unclassified Enterococcus]MDH6364672.1 DNA-binding MarR family transcriptional regulator [Enterococcus sp. PFB1-1]MDH6401773.1 DNA-binding MarR family transcriptional regulator [Enterococcus sp. PF1-24]